MSLYTDLVAAGIPVSSHYSDLYCPVNDKTRALLKQHHITTATIFTNQVEGGLWFDVPFLFDPYWEKDWDEQFLKAIRKEAPDLADNIDSVAAQHYMSGGYTPADAAKEYVERRSKSQNESHAQK